MSVGAAQSVAAATQSLSSPGTNAGAANGSPPREKDRTEAQTAPQFGEVMQNIQAKYGARPEKGREIKKTLGKDDFLRIMITQMKNQDPTKPFDAEQMASQMAQFTTVEQLKNMNDSLTKLTAPSQPMERLAMTSMIGKTITVDRSRFPHTENTNDQLSYGLPRDAAEVSISIISDQGETVFKKDLGAVKAGEGSFMWDGKKVNSLPAKAGTYMMRVDAKDAQGADIDSNPQSQARVIGVSFEGAEPVFLVGDNKKQEKVTMKSIVRIDSGDALPFQQQGAQAAPAAVQGGAPGGAALGTAQGVVPQAAGGGQFFTFQKGVGSQNLDGTTADAAVKRALAQYQAAPKEVPGGAAVAQNPGAQNTGAPSTAGAPQGNSGNPAAAAAGARAPASPPREGGGFPNGLHDDAPPSRAMDSNTSQTRKGGERR